jgi:hypothetical protein
MQELGDLKTAKAAVDAELVEVQTAKADLEGRVAELDADLAAVRSQLATTTAEGDAAKVLKTHSCLRYGEHACRPHLFITPEEEIVLGKLGIPLRHLVLCYWGHVHEISIMGR